jgi:hypothetical protein
MAEVKDLKVIIPIRDTVTVYRLGEVVLIPPADYPLKRSSPRTALAVHAPLWRCLLNRLSYWIRSL